MYRRTCQSAEETGGAIWDIVLFGPEKPRVKEERLVEEFDGRDVRYSELRRRRRDGGLRGSDEGKVIGLGVLL
jgi:hypothetical protein